MFLAFDSMTHLVREQHAMEFKDKIGAPGWFPVVRGAVLAVCLIVFHVPRTRVLGAILLTGYLGGAVTVKLYVARPRDHPPQPPEQLFASIGALGAQEQAAGTLIEVGGLMPKQAGAIVTLTGATIVSTDGPFVEATELVGGYCVYELPTWPRRPGRLRRSLTPTAPPGPAGRVGSRSAP